MDAETVDQFRLWLGLIANAFIIIGMPVLIAWATDNIRTKRADLEAKVGEEKWTQIDATVQAAVRFAEQSGVLKQLFGPEKKALAIEYAQKKLEEAGVYGINVVQLAELIENEVKHQFQNPTSVEDTIAAREKLLNQILDESIRAAEQSGFLGVIEDVGQAKKEHALEHAQTKLSEFGISLPPDMVTGLIEARLLRMLVNARLETEEEQPV